MLQVRLPANRPKARRYSVDLLLGEFLGLAYDVIREERPDVAITAEGRTLHIADRFFATADAAWLTPEALPVRPLPRWDLTGSPLEATPLTPDLPVLYGSPPWWREEGDDLWLGLDVFGSAFFLLTRYEEAVLPDRDRHERFPAEASLAVQEGFLDRPLVNEYLELLWRAIRRLWPGLTRKERAYRVLLSHDVDDPFCTAFRSGFHVCKSTAGDLVKRRSPALAFQRLAGAVRVRQGRPECDLCNTFGLIMDLSERRGWQSCFNFITDHTAGALDGRYAIDHPWIRGLLRQVHQRGHEIGLHPSYHTFLRPDRIKGECDRLCAAVAAEGITQTSFGGRQ
ncbi:MAG TPA: hypothetical protein VK464_13275, partial [Symbiobacteriaceae bacterium]|nr:hypothetical protein [Symbiobacteriaceae bacterium]